MKNISNILMILFEIIIIISILIILFLFTYLFIKTRKIRKFNIINQKVRKLLSENVFITRELIISNNKNIIDRLYKNQEDISYLFTEYDSKKTGTIIKNLLDNHIRIITSLISTIKNQDPENNNDSEIEKLAESAITNAKNIGIILNKINKNFGTRKYLTREFIKYIELIFDQIKNPDNINIFDNINNKILNISDEITLGFL